MVPREELQLFTPGELELLLAGLPDIDVADLRRNTHYGSGLSANDRLVQWFWAAVEAMSKQDVAALLQFVTGARRAALLRKLCFHVTFPYMHRCTAGCLHCVPRAVRCCSGAVHSCINMRLYTADVTS